MNLFLYSNYKKYVGDLMDHSEVYGGRGGRKRLAEALNSHLPHITLVLKDEAEFSLEQAQLFCDYVHLNDLESEYFMTLVESVKTSQPRLKNRFDKRLKGLRQQSQVLSERFEKTSTNEQSLEKYYSSWLHGAAHAGLSIPKYNGQLTHLARDLGVSMRSLSRVIGDLEREGIIKTDSKGRMELTNKRLHLPAGSRLINQHHLNWRSKCTEMIQHGEGGVNYSSVISVSASDADQLAEKIISFISEFKSVVKNSLEEEVFTFCLDFMRLTEKD